jgi:hypothetical protein
MTPSDARASELFARTAINSWQISLARLDAILDTLSDEDLQRQVAPGRNRAFYLLGHLAAVHDRMFPLLGLGPRRYESLDQDFITNPDRLSTDRVSAAELRRAWKDVNAALTQAMEALPAQAWLDKHDAVSAEDFAKEPLRNRLAVLLSRTAHVQFHTGQVRLVEVRSSKREVSK